MRFRRPARPSGGHPGGIVGLVTAVVEDDHGVVGGQASHTTVPWPPWVTTALVCRSTWELPARPRARDVSSTPGSHSPRGDDPPHRRSRGHRQSAAGTMPGPGRWKDAPGQHERSSRSGPAIRRPGRVTRRGRGGRWRALGGKSKSGDVSTTCVGRPVRRTSRAGTRRRDARQFLVQQCGPVGLTRTMGPRPAAGFHPDAQGHVPGPAAGTHSGIRTSNGNMCQPAASIAP